MTFYIITRSGLVRGAVEPHLISKGCCVRCFSDARDACIAASEAQPDWTVLDDAYPEPLQVFRKLQHSSRVAVLRRPETPRIWDRVPVDGLLQLGTDLEKDIARLLPRPDLMQRTLRRFRGAGDSVQSGLSGERRPGRRPGWEYWEPEPEVGRYFVLATILRHQACVCDIPWKAVPASSLSLSEQVRIDVAPRNASAEYARTFLSGAKMMLSLDHPALPKILDCGTLEDGRPYWIRERAYGRRYEPNPPDAVRLVNRETAREVIVCLLDLLDYVHRRGLACQGLHPESVHRVDGGPSTYRIEELRFLRGHPPIPSPPPQGADPELLAVRWRDPDLQPGQTPTPTSDLFQAGLYFFWLLTGDHLEARNHRQFPDFRKGWPIFTKENCLPRPLAAFRQDLPAAWHEAVNWLLQRNPQDRPASAAEVLPLFETD